MRPATLIVLIGLIGASCGQPSSAPSAGPEKPEIEDELHMVCDEDGSSLAATEARSQDDGLHLVIDNRLDYDPGMSVSYEGGGMGDSAPPGETTLVIPVPPGEVKVACYPKDHGDPEYQTATVVDPEGIYTPAELDCLEGLSQGVDYAEEPKGDPDPEAVARRRLEFGLIGGDEIVQAGYPSAESPVYVVIRDGDVVARTDLVRGSVGWYTIGYDACADYGN